MYRSRRSSLIFKISVLGLSVSLPRCSGVKANALTFGIEVPWTKVNFHFYSKKLVVRFKKLKSAMINWSFSTTQAKLLTIKRKLSVKFRTLFVIYHFVVKQQWTLILIIICKPSQHFNDKDICLSHYWSWALTNGSALNLGCICRKPLTLTNSPFLSFLLY